MRHGTLDASTPHASERRQHDAHVARAPQTPSRSSTRRRSRATTCCASSRTKARDPGAGGAHRGHRDRDAVERHDLDGTKFRMSEERIVLVRRRMLLFQFNMRALARAVQTCCPGLNFVEQDELPGANPPPIDLWEKDE